MITLEQACELYTKRCPRWPIDFITETETEWAFFQVTDGFYDVTTPVINKETGEISPKHYFMYEDFPRVPIPEKYVKDPPPQTCQGGLAAFFGGPIVLSDGTVLE